MAVGNSAPAEPRGEPERSLTITRSFDAPRAAVFAAWTEPGQIVKWLGPRGYTATHFEAAFRLGGLWRACIREDATGKQLWQSGVYREIVPPERLVFSFAWDAADGGPGHDTLITVTFEERRGTTTMTFHQAIFETQASRDSHDGGWRSTFDRLADLLTGDAR